MKRLLLMLTLLPALSMADYDVKFIKGMYTLHTPPICNAPQGYECDKFNTDNDLFIIALDNVFVGRMVNSYDNESFLLGLKHTHRVNRWEFTGGILAASGYPKYVAPFGRAPDYDNLTWLVGAMAGVSYNITPNWSFEGITQFTAVNFGLGLRF